MWRRSFKWTSLPSIFYLLHSPNANSSTTHFIKSTVLYNPSSLFVCLPISFVSKSFCSSVNTESEEDEYNNENLIVPKRPTKIIDPETVENMDTIMGCLKIFDYDAAQAKHNLENCNVQVLDKLAYEVLSRLRNDWGAAFTFFLWAAKQPGFSHSVHNYHLMISILGKMRRFDTAWSLVDEMRKESLVTAQTLLILIRKYCAVHEVAKAINVFYAFKRYGFELGIDEFHGLLSALCRYKNVADAETLLLCNEHTFPFETKSFNIILNGWCNVVVRVSEAKRFWREMGNRGVEKDVVSYGSMISCYSKSSNLNAVLKLFNHMKELGIDPDLRVYNAVIYALSKGKCIDQARNLLKTMEERGINPSAVTYNSLVRPLCKARQLADARAAFDEMLSKGLSPSPRTYHAFFEVFMTVEEVFDLLNRMKEAGCKPVSETYIMLIRKLSRWRQFDSVFKLWNDMRESGVSPDRSAYIVLIHGLFLNGKLEDAFKYYEEMKLKGFAPEPRTEEMIHAWLSGKKPLVESWMKELEEEKSVVNVEGKKSGCAPKISSHRRGSLKPEMKSVTRERGFSLW